MIASPYRDKNRRHRWEVLGAGCGFTRRSFEKIGPAIIGYKPEESRG